MPPKKDDSSEYERRTAISCFNKAWDFLDSRKRSSKDDLQMLLEVHTSRYHWGRVGKPYNLAIGDWQVSRVYAALKQPVLALLFARSSLDTCRRHGLNDLLPSAYEGMSRAYAVAKNMKQARWYLELARKRLELVEDDEDRKIYAQQMDETEALIRK